MGRIFVGMIFGSLITILASGGTTTAECILQTTSQRLMMPTDEMSLLYWGWIVLGVGGILCSRWWQHRQRRMRKGHFLLG
ncbi:MAG: hypothetical protein D6704_07760 [Nitrospirae bacterium]|nr:MAG: hypothetical protein D6704_07760 [Nitrospirota bacterium]